MKPSKMAVLIAWSASAAAAAPVAAPSQEDLKMLESTLAQTFLDPDSIILSDLLAAEDPTSTGPSITWICGNVRGKNSFGGYAPPRPFMAMAGELPSSDVRGVGWFKVAESDEQARLAEAICSQKFAFATAVDEAGPEVANDLKRQAELETVCLFDGPLVDACAEREMIVERLRARGFCVSSDRNWTLC